jgi:hypothetical protein
MKIDAYGRSHTKTYNPSRFWGGILILIGVVLELGQLGYAQTYFDSIWPPFMLAETFSNLFVASPLYLAVHAIAQAWPLVLVGAGFAAFIATRRTPQPILQVRRKFRESI